MPLTFDKKNNKLSDFKSRALTWLAGTDVRSCIHSADASQLAVLCIAAPVLLARALACL